MSPFLEPFGFLSWINICLYTRTETLDCGVMSILASFGNAELMKFNSLERDFTSKWMGIKMIPAFHTLNLRLESIHIYTQWAVAKLCFEYSTV